MQAWTSCCGGRPTTCDPHARGPEALACEANVEEDRECGIAGTTWTTSEVFQAVFTEQGASASQVPAAKVVNAFPRFTGMAGEANDAVSSAHTHTHSQEGRAQAFLMTREGCVHKLA